MSKITNLSDAFIFITDCFKDKKDKNGTPYRGHLVGVWNNLMIDYDDVPEYVQIAAFGHDLKEDIEEYNTNDKLLTVFDENVVSLIDILSKRPNESYSEFIHRIIESDNLWAIKIKLSDLKHNMDLTRLDVLTQKDVVRTVKYHASYGQLKTKLNEKNSIS